MSGKARHDVRVDLSGEGLDSVIAEAREQEQARVDGYRGAACWPPVRPQVWLITDGGYDRGIEYAFVTEALARAFIDRETELVSYHDFRVEPYDLLDELPTRIAAYSGFAVLTPEGEMVDFRVVAEAYDEGAPELRWLETPDDDRSKPRWVETPNTGGAGRLAVSWRRSRGEAERALQDLAARVKAERAGIT